MQPQPPRHHYPAGWCGGRGLGSRWFEVQGSECRTYDIPPGECTAIMPEGVRVSVSVRVEGWRLGVSVSVSVMVEGSGFGVRVSKRSEGCDVRGAGPTPSPRASC